MMSHHLTNTYVVPHSSHCSVLAPATPEQGLLLGHDPPSICRWLPGCLEYHKLIVLSQVFPDPIGISKFLLLYVPNV